MIKVRDVLAGALCAYAASATASSEVDLDRGFNSSLNPAIYQGIGQGSTLVAYDSLVGSPSFDVGRGIEQLPDGKFFAVALINPGENGQVGLFRLNADGSRDTSFGPIGQNGQVLRHTGVLSAIGPVRHGNSLFYAYSRQSGNYGQVVVCKVDLDGNADNSFRSWGWGDTWPAGCSIASSGNEEAYATILSDIDVEIATGWVVTAFEYRQAAGSNSPSNGAFTLMSEDGKDFSDSTFNTPFFHPVTAAGEDEAAREVRFSRAAGAHPHDFFLALDYTPSDQMERRAQIRRYIETTEQQRLDLPAQLGNVSVGAMTVETGPGSLGFDNALLLLLNRAAAYDAHGALYEPSLMRMAIDQPSGGLNFDGSTGVLINDFCDALAPLQIEESCLILDAAYDADRAMLWISGSWRPQDQANFNHVLLGRFSRIEDANIPGGYRYTWPNIAGIFEPYTYVALNASVGETRRHWGAAMLLDRGRPVILGDRQYTANEPDNADHDVLTMRFAGPPSLFSNGFE